MPDDSRHPATLPRVATSLARAAMRWRRPAAATTVLPTLQSQVRGWVMPPETLARYRALVASDAELPLAAPQVALTALHLALLADPDFPLRAVGLVHPGFTVEVLDEVPADQPWDLRAWIEGSRHVRSGLEFDLRGEVTVGGQVVWRSTAVTLSRSRAASGAQDSAVPRRDEDGPWPGGSVLAVPESAGRDFARVSGDVNPIHLHVATARLLGLRRPIAHGWWLAARTTALLAVDEAVPGRRLDIAFRRPVELPSAPVLASRTTPDGVDFALLPGGDGHVPEGASVRPLVLGRVSG